MAEFEGVKLWLGGRSADWARQVTGYLHDIGKLEGAKQRYTAYVNKLEGAKASKNSQTLAWIQQMSGYILDQMADIDREISHRKEGMKYAQGMSGKLEQAAQGLGRGGG